MTGRIADADDDSLTEEDRIRRVKEQCKVQIRENPSDEVAEMIDRTKLLRSGATTTSFLTDEKITNESVYQSFSCNKGQPQ